MNKLKLIKETITYLQLSSMDEKEKSMWIFMIPSMEPKHLLKLCAILKDESSQRIDLFLEGYKKGFTPNLNHGK